MDFVFADFNQAGAYFDAAGAAEWSDIESILAGMPLHLQASDQAGRIGRPIFDPKATNAYLTDESQRRGWRRIIVPAELQEFGVDWDGGKKATLAEWQFSNYPFLWNNIIRSEAIFKSQLTLGDLDPIRSLIVVTKGGLFPSSNSTLYYEQAKAQITNVTKFGTFTIPIRLVGLTVLPEVERIEVVWSRYGGRYSRDPVETARRFMTIRKRKASKYGTQGLSFSEEAG
jgi:hypothetical protein